jgi:hypothetical protein
MSGTTCSGVSRDQRISKAESRKGCPAEDEDAGADATGADAADADAAAEAADAEATGVVFSMPTCTRTQPRMSTTARDRRGATQSGVMPSEIVLLLVLVLSVSGIGAAAALS